jgi:hypothetical protein
MTCMLVLVQGSLSRQSQDVLRACHLHTHASSICTLAQAMKQFMPSLVPVISAGPGAESQIRRPPTCGSTARVRPLAVSLRRRPVAVGSGLASFCAAAKASSKGLRHGDARLRAWPHSPHLACMLARRQGARLHASQSQYHALDVPCCTVPQSCIICGC